MIGAAARELGLVRAPAVVPAPAERPAERPAAESLPRAA